MGMAKEALCCCCCYVLVVVSIIGFTVFVAVVMMSACVVPFRASVDEASLARLSLTAPAGNNGTPPASASSSLAYDLALVVALRRNSQAAGASRAAPLDAELRFLGRPLACAQLAGAEWEAIGGPSPRAGEPGKMVYRLAWSGENAALALGPGEAAAFAAESAAGVFELELVVAGDGEFKSAGRFRSRWCGVRVSCPLRLSVSTTAAPAPFERVECAP